MPLRPTFLGASVLDINCSLGFGSAQSELRVTLVEDPTNLDSFNPGLIGSPVSFTLGAFVFNGILRKFTENSNRGGNPTYEVIVSDPRHLLDDAKIITDNYRLAVT